MPNQANHNLSPLPVRLIAFAALALIAFCAIRVIDNHVMARANHATVEPAR